MLDSYVVKFTQKTIASKKIRQASERRWLPICRWVVVCFLTALGSCLYAEPPEEGSRFEAANRLYEQGKFTAAIDAYKAIAATGSDGAALQYNLGNAYYRSGQIGKARLHWRMAEQSSPRDPDVRANLALLDNRVGNSSPSARTSWERAFSYLTLNEWTMTCGILTWLWFILGFGGRIGARWRQATAGITFTVGALAILVWFGLGISAWIHLKRPIAVALTNGVPAHLGPLEESKTAFTLSEGTEARVTAERQGWLQVQPPGVDRRGWVSAESVAVIR